MSKSRVFFSFLPISVGKIGQQLVRVLVVLVVKTLDQEKRKRLKLTVDIWKWIIIR